MRPAVRRTQVTSSGRQAAALALVVLLSGACARVQVVRTENVDVPRGTRHQENVLPASTQLRVAPSIVKTDLTATLGASERCESVAISTVSRTQIVHREASGYSPAWSCTAGVLIAGGVATTAYLVTKDARDRPSPATIAGSALIWAALPGLIPCTVDLLRSSRSRKEVGLVDLPPVTRTYQCWDRQVADAPVSLHLAAGTSLGARTDSTGVATFALGDLPMNGLPKAEQRLRLTAGDLSADFALTQPQATELRTAVLLDPASRASRDLRDDACREALGGARRSAQGDLEDPAARQEALNAWERARPLCDAGRFPSVEGEQQDALRAASAAEERVAARVRLVQARAEARARIDHAREETLAALRRGDAGRARRALQAEPEIVSILREDAGVAGLVRQVSSTVVKQVAARGAEGGATPALCEARALHVGLLGQRAWDDYARSATRELGQGDPKLTSRLARTLGGAGCPR